MRCCSSAAINTFPRVLAAVLAQHLPQGLLAAGSYTSAASPAPWEPSNVPVAVTAVNTAADTANWSVNGQPVAQVETISSTEDAGLDILPGHVPLRSVSLHHHERLIASSYQLMLLLVFQVEVYFAVGLSLSRYPHCSSLKLPQPQPTLPSAQMHQYPVVETQNR